MFSASTPEFQALADLLARVVVELTPDELAILTGDKNADCCDLRPIFD